MHVAGVTKVQNAGHPFYKQDYRLCFESAVVRTQYQNKTTAPDYLCALLQVALAVQFASLQIAASYLLRSLLNCSPFSKLAVQKLGLLHLPY